MSKTVQYDTPTLLSKNNDLIMYLPVGSGSSTDGTGVVVGFGVGVAVVTPGFSVAVVAVAVLVDSIPVYQKMVC